MATDVGNKVLALFLSHVFPIAAGHVTELLAGIHALADADGFEVGAPEVLEKFIVLAHHGIVELTIRQIEGHGGFVLEGHAYDGFPVIIEPIMPTSIIDEPGLVVKTVLKVMGDERQHVMVGADDGEVGAVLRLLETDELLHAQLFVEYAAGDVRHRQHIGVGEVLCDVSLTENLTDIQE